MTPADHTVRGVAAILGADPAVSADLRAALVEALQRGGAVSLTTARKMLGMSRTSFWRARKDGKLALRSIGPAGRAQLVTVESVINGGNKA